MKYMTRQSLVDHVSGLEVVFLTYQLVVSVRIKQDYHEYGGLESDTGEGAWEMATTSKDGSRRENYPI